MTISIPETNEKPLDENMPTASVALHVGLQQPTPFM